MAASLSLLFGETGTGWKVEPGWWKRMPWDFKEQIEKYCSKCGACSKVHRRSSNEHIDDISPGMFERIKDNSAKIKRGEYAISDLKETNRLEKMAAYKDMEYRNEIANRYGMFFMINEKGFWKPFLKSGKTKCENKNSIYEELKRKYI
jgi:hypothetical protein